MPGSVSNGNVKGCLSIMAGDNDAGDDAGSSDTQTEWTTDRSDTDTLTDENPDYSDPGPTDTPTDANPDYSDPGPFDAGAK